MQHLEQLAQTDLAAFVSLYRETTRRGDDWHWTQWCAAWFARMVFEDVRRWWYWHITTPMQFARCFGTAEPWAWRWRRNDLEDAKEAAQKQAFMSVILAGQAVFALAEGHLGDYSRLVLRSALHAQASAKFSAIK